MAEFDFQYGALCLALTATLRNGGQEDLLAAPGATARWLHDAGLTTTTLPLNPMQTDGLIRLRTCLRSIAEAVMRGEPLPPMEVATLNAQAAMPLAIPQLDAASRTVLQMTADPVSVALATIARDAVTLFGGPDQRRIKQCEAEDCGVLFLDTSRGGRRRWCSMSRCGAKAKAKAFRDRHRRTETP